MTSSKLAPPRNARAPAPTRNLMRPARFARLGLHDTMTDSCLARGHLRCSLSTPSPFVQVPPKGGWGVSDLAHIKGTFRSGLSSPTPPQYCLLASANAANAGSPPC